MSKILIVEDEPDLAKQLEDWFDREKYVVEVVYDGMEALNRLTVYKYDVILLDWMLPVVEGIEVCRRFRDQGGVTPIIMLTAKAAVSDKESGLDCGADDYVTKPFSLRELAARVRAAIRRGSPRLQNVLQVGDLEIDPLSRKVMRAGRTIHLEPKEFNLLEFLIRHPNQVFSADALIDRVWQSDTMATGDAIRTYIKVLRRKLDSEGPDSIIKNVRGLGYKLEFDE